VSGFVQQLAVYVEHTIIQGMASHAVEDELPLLLAIR
jgi:hypothetical protein